LTEEGVQPGVTFLRYLKGELAQHGRFTSVAQDGKFRWIQIVGDVEYLEEEGYLADFGITQYAGVDGSFWGQSYSVAY